jgi:hypothetical protein
MTLQERLQTLIAQPHEDVITLRYALEQLAAEDPEAFTASTNLWFPFLYQRDPYYFHTFIVQHVNKNNAHLLKPFLSMVEDHPPMNMQTLLWRLCVPVAEQWADIQTWIATIADDDALIQKLDLKLSYIYHTDYLYFDDPTAAVLYQRLQRNQNFLNHTLLYHLDTKRHYPHLLKTIEASGNTDFYWQIFRRVADLEAWRAELTRILNAGLPVETVTEQIAQAKPDNLYEIGPEVWNAFIEKYGDPMRTFLETHFSWFLRQRISRELEANQDNQTLLNKMNELARQNWRAFPETADLWLPALIERDPSFFSKFIRYRLGWGQASRRALIQPVLQKLEANGYTELFTALYRNIADEAFYNQEIAGFTVSDWSDEDIFAALNRRHVDFKLEVSVAIGLYQRNPDIFREFVRARIKQGSGDMKALREMVRLHGDDDFYWALFRESAENTTWHESLEALLSQDIPGTQIVAELEKRHPNYREHIDPSILKQFLSKYGADVVPYLEKYMNGVTPRRIEALFKADLDRTLLLRELEKMARGQPDEFRAAAALWAPALYERDGVFFENFLIRNLDRRAAPVIYGLLPRIEANGQDALFARLYGRITSAADWDRQIAMLAASNQADDIVLRAITRREGSRWWTLTEETAVALYQRNPVIFSEYLQANLHRSHSGQRYAKLYMVAEAQHDDDLCWKIACTFSTQVNWKTLAEKFLEADLPLETVTARLAKLPTDDRANADIFKLRVSLLERYGDAIWPFLSSYLTIHISPERVDTLLNTVRKLDREDLAREIIFKTASSKTWNQMLHDALKSGLTGDALTIALMQLIPPTVQNTWQRLVLTPETALELYRHIPQLARTFIDQFGYADTIELFQAAEANHDEEMLDLLTYKLVVEHNHAYHWRDRNGSQPIFGLAQARLDRLYAESAQTYVDHAANILSRVRAFAIWNVQWLAEHQPLFKYLKDEHHEAWRASANGIRELLESPNIHIQILGLEILSAGGPEAAERVMENLAMFRTMLLSRMRRATKKMALACLTRAMEHKTVYAVQILPILEDTQDYRGKNAISEDILITYVRTRHRLKAQADAQPTVEGVLA